MAYRAPRRPDPDTGKRAFSSHLAGPCPSTGIGSPLRSAIAASLAGVLLWVSFATDLSPAADLSPREQGVSGSDVLVTDTTVRRICVQMGVQTFHIPDKKAQIAIGDPILPARLGGGVYVQFTGLRQNGYVHARTLNGAGVWIPENEPESGDPSLCTAHATAMRVCRKDTPPQDVPIQADFEVEAAPPVALAKRGSLIRLWGYFEERGRWAFVETRGKVGFIRSEELCHEDFIPPSAKATERFGMIVTSAKPHCYQWRRERGANEIRRIIIHNSEKTLESTIATFQECDPERPTAAHVGIDRDGKIYRFVEDKFTAFHTGGSVNSGGFNSISLGIELIAYDKPGFTFMTPQQERSLLALVRFWAKEYNITFPQNVMENSTRSRAYYNLEFWRAPVTIHRLVSADRGTDCPKFIWADSVQGDEEFFLWRRKNLGDGTGA